MSEEPSTRVRKRTRTRTPREDAGESPRRRTRTEGGPSADTSHGDGPPKERARGGDRARGRQGQGGDGQRKDDQGKAGQARDGQAKDGQGKGGQGKNAKSGRGKGKGNKGGGQGKGDKGGGQGDGPQGRRSGKRRRNRSSQRRGQGQRPKQPKDGRQFWGEAERLPSARTDVRLTNDPDAVPRSLGPPPLPGHESIAAHYFGVVYDRAVTTASALAAAGGLIDPDALTGEDDD